SKTVGGVKYPGLYPYGYIPVNPAGNPVPTLSRLGPTFLAADADGDGIADSGLWKLPIGSIDGLTYYVAVRMVDNNSAININTAWSNRDFSLNGIVFSQANANATY